MEVVAWRPTPWPPPGCTSRLPCNLRFPAVVPGIELVPTRNAPTKNDLRYCAGKVDPGTLESVQKAEAAAIDPAPTPRVLDPSLCNRVRVNHFEVWYARPAG